MKGIAYYILFSDKLNRFYIGACQENLEQRQEKHNTSFYGKQCYTSTADHWEFFLFIPTKDFAHAIRLERKIKNMKSSAYIKNLKKYPELVDKIFSETK